MRAYIRQVQLRVVTPGHTLGRSVRFGEGLNIVRGGNSRGKTQVVQAIIYSLGLERMLTARANLPLGSAMTSEVKVAQDFGEATEPVVSSWTAIELENEAGDRLVAQRFVQHPQYQPDLVRVWRQPMESASDRPEEYFVHQPGSATHEHGFHRLLADFLDWPLPQVSNYAGQPVTLYVDVIFPFLIADQQSWGSASPRKVERYQIRDPLRRAAEFLLALEGPTAAVRRAELERELNELRTRWAAARSAATATANAVGARVVGLAQHAAGAQARSGEIEASDLNDVHLEVMNVNESVPVNDLIRSLGEQANALRGRDERRIAPGVNEDLVRDLGRAKGELADLLAAARLVEQDLSLNEAQLAALDRRIDSLQEEKSRNSDVRTLTRLGSTAASAHLADHNCPTCRQSLDAVEGDRLGPVLDVDETIALLNAQISTAQKMRDATREAADYGDNTFRALQRQADQLQARVRALEDDLVAPTGSPSSGDIAERLTLDMRIAELRRAQDAFDELIDTLGGLAFEIAGKRTSLNALPEGMPASDLARIERLTVELRRRLADSGFGSYNVSQLKVDLDTLRPTREAIYVEREAARGGRRNVGEVDTDASASDVVRIKIAYLDAVRALGTEFGPHPGFLILDELRQQEMELDDYISILKYLAPHPTQKSGQVVATTTTPLEELAPVLASGRVNLVDLGDERLLTAIEERHDPDAL